MRTRQKLAPLTLLLLGLSGLAFGQVNEYVPVLWITSPIDGNGMGGIAASVLSENAMAMSANPGILGIQSLHKALRSSIYTTTTSRGLAFPVIGSAYNCGALNVGFNLSDIASLPIPASIGLGYCRTLLTSDAFVWDGTHGTIVEDHERSDAFSLGFGLEYFVQLGFGVSYRTVESVIAPETTPRTFSATLSSYDFGLIALVPGREVISKLTGASLKLPHNIDPVFDITGGLAGTNFGNDRLSYFSPSDGDPLPRKATAGFNLKAGFSAQTVTGSWEFFSFTVAREAEDLLLFWTQDTIIDPEGGIISITDREPHYQDWPGDLNIFSNVLKGEANGEVGVRKGWQLNLAEILFLRGGSFEGPGLAYRTSGFGLRLRGMFHLVESFKARDTFSPLLAFVADHVDIQFDHASESSGGPRNGSTYDGLSFTVH